MKKKIYYATVEGHISGAFRKKGESVGELTDREAKYPLMSGLITDKSPEDEKPATKRDEPDPATLDRKTR